MPFWRRRGAPAPAAAPGLPPADLGPLPPAPEVPGPPADLDGVAERLTAAGADARGLDLLGSAGALPVCGWDVEAGDGAVARWRELRALHRSTGLWPVLLGPRDELDESFAFRGGEPDPDDLVEGTRARPAEVLARLVAEVSGGDDSPVRERPRLPRQLHVLPERFEVTGQPGVLAVVPAAAGWQVPGLVSWWGAANADLPPADHVAVLRSWEHRFGAELVVLTNDAVELAVARPPTAPAEVVAVARELYGYCPDVVDQGVGSLEALCLEMVVRRSWALWWD